MISNKHENRKNEKVFDSDVEVVSRKAEFRPPQRDEQLDGENNFAERKRCHERALPLICPDANENKLKLFVVVVRCDVMRRAHPSLPFAIIIIIIGVSYCDNELKSLFQRLLRKQKKAKKVQASMLLTAQESNFANGTKSDPYFVFNNLFNCLHFLPSSSYRLRAQRAVRFSRDEVWSGFHRSTTTQLCRFSLNPQRPVRRLSNERWEIVQKFVRKFEKFTQHEFAPSRSKKNKIGAALNNNFSMFNT